MCAKHRKERTLLVRAPSWLTGAVAATVAPDTMRQVVVGGRVGSMWTSVTFSLLRQSTVSLLEVSCVKKVKQNKNKKTSQLICAANTLCLMNILHLADRQCQYPEKTETLQKVYRRG